MLTYQECVKELEDHLREIEMCVQSIENGTRTIVHNGMNAGHLHIESARKDYAITAAALVILKTRTDISEDDFNYIKGL